ncbi:MAG: hypothetical protein CM1200mP38_7860 [Dehalococcoidia bacterium]|nr:MAG: hypothetical protein CM1200mP38_7860 [Dehalococcoidia bacterium]
MRSNSYRPGGFILFKEYRYVVSKQDGMDTIGTTRKFVHCVAENEDASPWPSFAEDRGFSRMKVVSIFITMVN